MSTSLEDEKSQQIMEDYEGFVLLVDDNPNNLKLLTKILQESGYKIKASTSGKFALQMVRTTPPDLILLDIMMPEMDGYEVCRQLKSNPDTADIPVIFISALSYIKAKLKAFEAGGVDYVNKPFNEAEVLARVSAHVTLRKTIQQLKSRRADSTVQLLQEDVGKHKEDSAREKFILLVDDNPNNLKLLTKILEESGFKIKASTSGKFALQAVQATPPDLILLDIMMPEMDGYEVSKQLKLNPDTADIPIIFISALSETDDKLKAFAAGGVDYVSKPFQEAEVLARVNTHLTLRKIREELEGLVEHRTAQLAVKTVELKEETDERIQISQELQKSEQRYREIFNATDESIIIHDSSTGAILEVNQATLEMFSYSQEETLNLGVGELSKGTYPYNQEEALTHIQKAVEEGPQEFEWLCKKKNGELFVGEINLKSSEIGGQSRVIAIVRDITERKKAEKELLDSEEKYRQLFENANEGMAVIQDGAFVFFNPKTLMISEYAKKELQSKPFEEIIHPDDRDIASGLFKQKLQKNKLSNLFMLRIITKNGREKYIEFKHLPISWEEKPATLVFFTDISKRHSAELQQKKLESQLRQAQKMEAIGTLAGGVAHDFNNILAGIFGYTQLAQMNIEKTDSLIKYLSQIYDGAVRARDLVQQILTFSRQAEAEMLPIYPHLVIKEALKLLRASIPSTIDIREELSKTNMILADPTHIHQIVMNLCTNSYHAMMEKGGTLSISLKDIDIEENERMLASLAPKRGSFLVLTVSDSGIGMNKATMDKIFDPYFTTKPKAEGTGLGLSVVHGIVENCGGHISVYSEPGEGTTFKIYFPSILPKEKRSSEKPAEPMPTGTEHILVVDDEENIVETMEQMLKSLGYQVTAHLKSSEAIQDFENRPNEFALVITDMNMPHISGAELIKRLHAKNNKISVILCTGFSKSINEKKFKAHGFQKILMKPVIMRDLANTVREVLDGS